MVKFFLLSSLLHAQTAARIQELLKTDAVTYEQAAQLVLEAADVGFFEGNIAFNYVMDQKWLPKNTAPDTKARLDGVSLLVMQSFDIRGGLFFLLFKNPRYAYRELVYRNIIQGKADPAMAVSGDMLLHMINRIFFLYGEPSDEEVISADEELRRKWAAQEAERLESERLKLQAAIEELQQQRELLEAERRELERAAAEQTEATRRLEEQIALVREINSRLAQRSIFDTGARVTEDGVTISVSNIQFAPDSAVLPESELPKFREIGRILQGIPARRLLITGHTALAGTEEGRQTISQERAQAVADYLISVGIRSANEIEVRGYGSQRPIADNSTPGGMALNRRVEITILESRR